MMDKVRVNEFKLYVSDGRRPEQVVFRPSRCSFLLETINYIGVSINLDCTGCFSRGPVSVVLKDCSGCVMYEKIADVITWESEYGISYEIEIDARTLIKRSGMYSVELQYNNTLVKRRQCVVYDLNHVISERPRNVGDVEVELQEKIPRSCKWCNSSQGAHHREKIFTNARTFRAWIVDFSVVEKYGDPEYMIALAFEKNSKIVFDTWNISYDVMHWTDDNSHSWFEKNMKKGCVVTLLETENEQRYIYGLEDPYRISGDGVVWSAADWVRHEMC